MIHVPRLPTPGSDTGKWGEILNDFLSQAHTSDGHLKTDSVTAGQLASGSVVTAALADGAVTNSKLDTPTKASLAKADTAVQSSDLGAAASLDVGTATGTVAAGDDSRIIGASQKSANLGDLEDLVAARSNLGAMSSITLSAEILRSRLANAAARTADLDRSVMTSPPTVITATSPDAALTRAYLVKTTPESFSLVGGRAVVYATEYVRFPVVTIPTGSGNVGATGPGGEQQSANGFAVEFMADADVVQIRMLNSTTTFRIEVNGQSVGAAAIAYPATGGTGYAKLTFGSRDVRKIRFEASQNAGFRGVDVGPTCSIWASPSERLTAVCLGDSIAAQTGSTLPNGGWAWTLGKLLGWSDVWQVAIGGSGFTVSGTGGSTFGSAARIVDIVAANPNLIVLAASSNDPDTSATTTAALATFQAYRTALPLVPIVITGILSRSGTTLQGVEVRVKTAFDSWADSNSYWIPVCNDTSGAWITGTGRVGATTGDGNADLYINSADSVHPSQAGHDYIATRLAHSLRSSPLLARHS